MTKLCQIDGEGGNHIRKTASFGEGNRLTGNHQNLHA
jgi:hypothetical protein